MTSSCQVHAATIRLSNNELESIEDIAPAIHSILIQPSFLKWVDLSFNHLTNLGEVVWRHSL